MRAQPRSFVDLIIQTHPIIDDPFRDYVNDAELRIAIGHKLMELVANGVTDPVRLGYLTLKSLPLPRH